VISQNLPIHFSWIALTWQDLIRVFVVVDMEKWNHQSRRLSFLSLVEAMKRIFNEYLPAVGGRASQQHSPIDSRGGLIGHSTDKV
jgi:hypothetical protein